MNRPRTFLIAAISADGFIAKNYEDKIDWTSTEDKTHFAELTRAAGVVIMGNNTFKTIGRPLPNRLNVVYTNSQKQSSSTDKILMTNQPPQELLEQLARQDFSEVAIIGGQKIYDLFLNEHLIDEMYLTITPQTFGSGIPLTMANLSLSLISQKTLNPSEILLHYKIVA